MCQLKLKAAHQVHLLERPPPPPKGRTDAFGLMCFYFLKSLTVRKIEKKLK